MTPNPNPGFQVVLITTQGPRFNRGWPIVLATVFGLLAHSCSSSSDELTVFVASSMVEAIGVAATFFEQTQLGQEVVIVSGSSDRLAAQINDGASADLFVAADWTSMELVSSGVMGEAVVIASTHLTIAVAPGNPKQIEGLGDLDRTDIVLVLAAAEVPLGRYSNQILAEAGVKPHPASLELDAISVLGRVERGEADVGLVYAADLYDRGVEAIETPAVSWLRVEYPAAVLSGGGQSEGASALLEFLLSDKGRLLLVTAGFELP